MRLSHRTGSDVGTGMHSEETPFGIMVAQLLESLEAPSGAVVRWTDGRFGADGPVWDHSIERMLVQSACSGDDEALDLLLRHEWYAVYRLVSDGASDGALAEELAQEVFARAIATLDRLQVLGVPFHSYCVQIAHRLLRDRRRAMPPGAPGGTPGHFVAPEGPGLVVLPSVEDAGDVDQGASEPAVVVLSSDDRPRFVAALDRLPRSSRELLWLRLIEGRTEHEIGVEWGRTPESVHELQRQALAALRAGLANGAAADADNGAVTGEDDSW